MKNWDFFGLKYDVGDLYDSLLYIIDIAQSTQTS